MAAAIKASSTAGESVCSSCSSDVKSGDRALECNLCEKWFHIKCVNFPNDLYLCIKKHGDSDKGAGIHWYCTSCNSVAAKAILTIQGLQDRQTKLESRQDKVEQEMQGVKIEFEGIRAQYADIVKIKSDPPSSMGTAVAATNIKTVQIEINECMEREKRKKNLVIVGIEENDDDDIVANKVSEVVRSTGGDKFEIIGRVGKKLGNKPRLIRVCIEDGEDRTKILKGAVNLRNVTGLERVFVMPDLTKMQQETEKKLRDKLKEIRQAGENDAKINKGDIVKFVNGQRQVLYSQDN
jgi:PHD-finger